MALVVSFRAGGNSPPYRQSGWSFQEPDRIWTIGSASALRLPGSWERRALTLELDLTPHIQAPWLLAQLLRVSVNGHALGSYRLTDPAVLRVDIPPGAAAPGEVLDIRFEHPGYLSPKSLGVSADARPIAIAFHTARLFTVDLRTADIAAAWTPGDAPIGGLTPPVETQDAGHGDAEAAPPSDNRMVYGYDRPSPYLEFLGEGWASGWSAGHDGPNMTWSNAALSRIDLPCPGAPGPHLLWLHVIPLVAPSLPAQEFMLFLDGIMLGSFKIFGDSVLAIPVPPELPAGRSRLSLVFDLPTAARPSDLGLGEDRRYLAVSLAHAEIVAAPVRLAWLASGRFDEAAPITPLATSARFLQEPAEGLLETIATELGVRPVDFLRRFESLGNNCEFGTVATKLGIDLLNLFRFGSIRLPGLLRGFAEDFSAFDKDAELSADLNDEERPEHLFAVQRYQGRWHTRTYLDELTAKKSLENQKIKFSYLRRKFLEGLRSSGKIYVIKREPALSVPELSALLLELNRYGRNTLLNVTTCGEGRRSGCVELVGPGLMRGYIEAFAPGDNVEEATDPSGWLRVLGNAWVIDSLDRSD